MTHSASTNSELVEFDELPNTHGKTPSQLENDVPEKGNAIEIQTMEGEEIPVARLRNPDDQVNDFAGKAHAYAYIRYLEDNPQEFQGSVAFLGTVKNASAADSAHVPTVYEDMSGFGVLWRKIGKIAQRDELRVAKLPKYG